MESVDQESWIDDEQEEIEVPASIDEPADTLDAARIRRRLLVRRNAMRSRSHLLIVGTALALAALRLAYAVATDLLATGPTPRPVIFATLGLLMLLGACIALSRAAAEKRLYNDAAPPVPDHEPSFEGLGDGAKSADRRLEDML